MNYWVWFWIFTLSLIVAISALGFLTLAFVFPDVELLRLGRAGRLAVAVVGVAAIGVVVLTATTFGGETSENIDRHDW